MKIKIIFALAIMVLLLTACVSAQPQATDVDAIVQATFQALTAQANLPIAAASTSTPLPIAAAPTQGGTDNISTFTPVGGLSGSISGKLSYPSNFIPSLAVVAYVAGGSPLDYYYVIMNEGSSTYQLDNLPPGNYYVVAYVIGGGLNGGYSQAVPCGLSVECGDHSLIAVTVNAGQVTYNVDPGDWYAPDGSFPAYPLP